MQATTHIEVSAYEITENGIRIIKAEFIHRETRLIVRPA